jgi:hypothetical protein
MRRFGRSSSKSGPHREKSRVIAFSRSVKKADQRRQKRGRASGTLGLTVPLPLLGRADEVIE